MGITQELFNAEMPLSERTAKLEAVFQQHWNTKRKEEAEMEAKEKPNNKGGTTATDTSKVAWPVSRLFLSAPAVVSRKPKEDEPFPGIPLHRESKSVQASLRPEEGIASSSEEQKTERAEASEPSVSEQETTVRQSDQTVRPTEVEENYGRGLSSLEKAIASSGQSEHYQTYAECIRSLLAELRALKRSSVQNPGATAEILCLLSHSSLDAARMLVACQKAGSNQADAEIKQPTTADGHKAKEGHCSVSEELDGGGTTKESLSASDEVTLRLQRCLELFEATKQNLARIICESSGNADN